MGWSGQIFEGLVAGDDGHLLLQAFNRGEEFEDHEKNEDKAGQNHSVDVAFDPDGFGQGIGETWKHDYDAHATPDGDPDY